MKKLFFAAGLVVAGFAGAQTTFGVTGGLAVFGAKAKVLGTTVTDSQVGGYAGGFADIYFTESLHFTPGLNGVFANDAFGLQVPLMIKYNVIPQLNVALGPQLFFDLGEIPAEFGDYYNRTNIGIAFGAGYDITDNLLAEARFGIQLNDHIKSNPADISAKMNVLNVGVGYKF